MSTRLEQSNENFFHQYNGEVVYLEEQINENSVLGLYNLKEEEQNGEETGVREIRSNNIIRRGSKIVDCE